VMAIATLRLSLTVPTLPTFWCWLPGRTRRIAPADEQHIHRTTCPATSIQSRCDRPHFAARNFKPGMTRHAKSVVIEADSRPCLRCWLQFLESHSLRSGTMTTENAGLLGCRVMRNMRRRRSARRYYTITLTIFFG
jgi:hypothetical protein